MGKLREYYRKLLLSHASAEEVAQGFALGVFIGITPTFGLHIILAIVCAAYLKKNELAAILGVFVTNPITAVPVYYFCFHVGTLITGQTTELNFADLTFSKAFSLGADILFPLWIGCLAVGLVAYFAAYGFAIKVYPFLKRKLTKPNE